MQLYLYRDGLTFRVRVVEFTGPSQLNEDCWQPGDLVFCQIHRLILKGDARYGLELFLEFRADRTRQVSVSGAGVDDHSLARI